MRWILHISHHRSCRNVASHTNAEYTTLWASLTRIRDYQKCILRACSPILTGQKCGRMHTTRPYMRMWRWPDTKQSMTIPTHERLHKIRLVPTDLCRQCNGKDTLLHRLRLWRRATDVGMDVSMHSNNIGNGLEAYTVRLAATPIVQAVAPSTPPRCIVVTCQLCNLPSENT
jgi:hypothetical protein